MILMVPVFFLGHILVKWGSCTSILCSVSNGVKQGGVMSPTLFNGVKQGGVMSPILFNGVKQ